MNGLAYFLYSFNYMTNKAEHTEYTEMVPRTCLSTMSSFKAMPWIPRLASDRANDACGSRLGGQCGITADLDVSGGLVWQPRDSILQNPVLAICNCCV